MAGTRLLSRVVLAVCLAAAPAIASPQPVGAHCPEDPAPGGRSYASGYDYLGGASNGIRGNISWTNPPYCSNGGQNPFTMEGVTLCPNDFCQGWVQVGWFERFNVDTSPKFFCEYKRTDAVQATQYYLPLSAASHQYSWQRESNGWWTCRLDGATQINTGQVNFASGLWGNAQGETNAAHAQIGRMAPGSVLFSNLHYRSAGLWYTMGLTLPSASAPYGRDTIGGGTLRNWTNAH